MKTIEIDGVLIKVPEKVIEEGTDKTDETYKTNKTDKTKTLLAPRRVSQRVEEFYKNNFIEGEEIVKAVIGINEWNSMQKKINENKK
jgi:hypothetical protein